MSVVQWLAGMKSNVQQPVDCFFFSSAHRTMRQAPFPKRTIGADPIDRPGIPCLAHEILNRINEISFNPRLKRSCAGSQCCIACWLKKNCMHTCKLDRVMGKPG